MDYDKSPAPASLRRRPVTFTIRPDILDEARALGVNASRAAESGIQAEITARRQKAWLKTNAEAIALHNRRVDDNGVLIPSPWAGE